MIGGYPVLQAPGLFGADAEQAGPMGGFGLVVGSAEFRGGLGDDHGVVAGDVSGFVVFAGCPGEDGVVWIRKSVGFPEFSLRGGVVAEYEGEAGVEVVGSGVESGEGKGLRSRGGADDVVERFFGDLPSGVEENGRGEEGFRTHGEAGGEVTGEAAIALAVVVAGFVGEW